LSWGGAAAKKRKPDAQKIKKKSAHKKEGKGNSIKKKKRMREVEKRHAKLKVEYKGERDK